MGTLKYTRKIEDEVDKHVYEHHASLESLRQEAEDLRTGRYWWYGTFIGAAIVYVLLQQLGAAHWPGFAVALPVVLGGAVAGIVTGMYAEEIERTVRNIAVGMLVIAVTAWLFHLI